MCCFSTAPCSPEVASVRVFCAASDLGATDVEFGFCALRETSTKAAIEKTMNKIPGSFTCDFFSFFHRTNLRNTPLLGRGQLTLSDATPRGRKIWTLKTESILVYQDSSQTRFRPQWETRRRVSQSSRRRIRWWVATQASTARSHSGSVVSHPPLKRTTLSAQSPRPMAVRTCEGFSLPLAHADPLEAATPAASRRTTQRCLQSNAAGARIEMVFHKRCSDWAMICNPLMRSRSCDSMRARIARRSAMELMFAAQ